MNTSFKSDETRKMILNNVKYNSQNNLAFWSYHLDYQEVLDDLTKTGEIVQIHLADFCNNADFEIAENVFRSRYMLEICGYWTKNELQRRLEKVIDVLECDKKNSVSKRKYDALIQAIKCHKGFLE